MERGEDVGKLEGDGLRQRDRELLKWAEEFQPKQALISKRLLAANFSLDGGSLAGDQAGRRRRGRRNGQKHGLIRAQEVSRGDAGPRGADVQRPGQFDEFCAGGVRSAEEYRHLQANSRGGSSPLRIHANALLQLINTQVHRIRVIVLGN